jgi:hypothetical protein
LKKIRAIAATGNLSSGFREETLVRAVEQGADFIGCDAGTTDSGPYYLGSGNPRGPREGTKRNLRIMIGEGLKAGIPVIVGLPDMQAAGRILPGRSKLSGNLRSKMDGISNWQRLIARSRKKCWPARLSEVGSRRFVLRRSLTRLRFGKPSDSSQ